MKLKEWLRNTHTHTRLTALFPGLPGWVGTRKVKPIWILLKQETVTGSSISWAICKSAPRSRQITMPAPHHSVFYRPDALPAARMNDLEKQIKLQDVQTSIATYFLHFDLWPSFSLWTVKVNQHTTDQGQRSFGSKLLLTAYEQLTNHISDNRNQVQTTIHTIQFNIIINNVHVVSRGTNLDKSV